MNAIRIDIPAPCQEQWNSMTPVDDQHAHCAACDRVLVDFTQMDDTELAVFLRQSGQNVCGRFRQEQLEKRIALPAEKPVRKYWLNAIWLLPLSFFAKPAQGQVTPHIILDKPPRCVPLPAESVAQKTDTVKTQAAARRETEVRGTVTDAETGQPLANALVRVRMKDGSAFLEETRTDASGNFSLEKFRTLMPGDAFSQEFVILVTRPGYDFRLVAPKTQDETLSIKLRKAEQRHKMGKPMISKY